MFLNAAASLMARLATESKGPVTGRMTEIKEMAGMDVCSEKTEALALHKLSADKIIEILHRVHAATITRALSFGVIVKKITCDQLAIAKTGDTVYDAPALKKADIAIAIADTIDAARSSSDILLTKPGHQRMENYTVSGIIQPIACLLLLYLLVLPFVSALTNPQEVQVLQGMYASLNLSSVGDPCKDSWKGIRCSESSVVSIELARQDLNGTLGGNLFGLQNLKKLDLSYNNIEGAIPLSLPPNATHINLAFNKFNQSIPFSLNPMKYLESLNVSHNALSCQLGNVFTGFPSLKQLDLSYNSFTGKLPNSISTSTNLTSLFLQRNMFEGSVALLEHLPLKDLWIQMNEFSGPIPQTFWNITNLRVERNYFRDDVPHVLGRGGEEDGEISSPEGDGKIKPPMADNVPTKKNGMTKIFYGLLWGFIALVVVCGGGALIWYCWYRKKSTTGGSIELGKQRFKCN